MTLSAGSTDAMTATALLALDLGSRSTGWCEGAPGTRPRMGSQRMAPEGSSPGEHWNALFRWLWDRLALGDIREVWIEAPVDPANFRTPRRPETGLILIGLYAVATQVCRLRKTPSHSANVIEVRRAFIGGHGFLYGGKPVVGRGNLPGKMAKFCVMDRLRQLGLDPPNEDAGDAAALWHFGCAKRDPAAAARQTPLFERAA